MSMAHTMDREAFVNLVRSLCADYMDYSEDDRGEFQISSTNGIRGVRFEGPEGTCWFMMREDSVCISPIWNTAQADRSKWVGLGDPKVVDYIGARLKWWLLEE